MKKFLTAVLAVFMISTGIWAQTAKKAAPVKKKVTTEAMAEKKAVQANIDAKQKQVAKPSKTAKVVAATPETKAAARTKPAPELNAIPAKKDGTPDMRYSANKKAALTPDAPKKKDGTPDKRYKATKATKRG